MAARETMDRSTLIDWYRRNRQRSAALFDLVSDEAYYARPISLRHPLVFYEGHLPGFSFNTLVKRGLGLPSIDSRLETLFARGIDPAENQDSGAARDAGWPTRETVRQFAAEADRQVIDVLARGDLDQPGHPLLDRGEAAFAILEHEAMHQETLLYMWHRLPLDQKRRPAGYAPLASGPQPRQEWIDVPPGWVTLGVNAGDLAFSWDNERPLCRAEVPGFSIERHDVTNAAFLEFVEAGGYRDPRWWRAEDWAWVQRQAIAHPLFWERTGENWWWRGMFDLVPLPLAWPVFVSQVASVPSADRSRVPARGVRYAIRNRAAPSLGRRVPDTCARGIRLLVMGSRAGRQPSGRTIGLGCRRPGRGRLGVDVNRVFAVPGLQGAAVLSGVLGRLLRRRALGHEGRVPGDRP
jgi:hypothetical protein